MHGTILNDFNTVPSSGTILVKANHIARLSKNNNHSTWLLSNQCQYLAILILIFIGLAVSLVWIFTLDRPRIEISIVDHEQQEVSCSYLNDSKGASLWSFYNAGEFFFFKEIIHHMPETRLHLQFHRKICVRI